MKALLKSPNQLEIKIAPFKTRRAMWTEVDDRAIPDFPQFQMKDLHSLTMGVYQVLCDNFRKIQRSPGTPIFHGCPLHRLKDFVNLTVLKNFIYVH